MLQQQSAHLSSRFLSGFVQRRIAPFVLYVNYFRVVLQEQSGHFNVAIAGRIVERYEAAFVFYFDVGVILQKVLGYLQVVVARG
jgi:hypothetical protein